MTADAASGDAQRTLIRLRDKRTEKSDDFVVVLETRQATKMPGGCHIMVASRDTSLQEVAQNFSSFRPEALAEQSAGNDLMNIGVAIDAVAKGWIFYPSGFCIAEATGSHCQRDLRVAVPARHDGGRVRAEH